MPVHHLIRACLCSPFLSQSFRGSRAVSLVPRHQTKRVPCLLHLCTCHGFTLPQNSSSRQGRVKMGFKGVCLASLTSQLVQAAISQALHVSFVIHLLPFPTRCPAFPLLRFQRIAKNPKLAKAVLFSSELAC